MAHWCLQGLLSGNVGFELVIGLVGICWITRLFLTGENPLGQLAEHPLVIPSMIWFAAIVASLLINGPGSKGWAHDVAFIRYLIFILALLDVSRRLPVFKYLLYGLAAGVILAAVNMMSAHIFGYDMLGKPLERYTGKLKEAARIAGIASYAAPFFLAWGLFDKRLSIKKKGVDLFLSCQHQNGERSKQVFHAAFANSG